MQTRNANIHNDLKDVGCKEYINCKIIVVIK